MSTPAPRHRYTFAEYLEVEEIARVRHEYYQGEIYAMVGGTREHAAMVAAITSMLGRQLASPCRVYSSDLRVRVLATGLATYPDVTVICGPSERDPESATHVTNPKVIVEVLSDGTADYERGEKLQHYQKVESLEAVILVDHRAQQVELLRPDQGGWRSQRYVAGDVVPVTAIQCSLSVDEIYAAACEA